MKTTLTLRPHPDRARMGLRVPKKCKRHRWTEWSNAGPVLLFRRCVRLRCYEAQIDYLGS